MLTENIHGEGEILDKPVHGQQRIQKGENNKFEGH